jgi:hypothetical protein
MPTLLLLLLIEIVECHRIIEDETRELERHIVLAQVGCRFPVVPFEPFVTHDILVCRTASNVRNVQNLTGFGSVAITPNSPR